MIVVLHFEVVKPDLLTLQILLEGISAQSFRWLL